MPRDPRRPYLAGLAGLLTALLVACGTAAPADGVDADALPALVAREELRIGSVEDPEYGFSRIGSVAVDGAGRVYVFEAMDVQLRVYSPEGGLLHRFGRQGEGPGEFGAVSNFGVHGDTVWVYDLRAQRLTLFNRQGTLLGTAPVGTVRVPLPNGFGYLHPRVMRADGRMVSDMTSITVSVNDPPTGVQPTDRIPVPRVLYGLDGAVLDTVGWDDRPPPRMWRAPGQDEVQNRSIDVGGRRVRVPNPPSMAAEWLPLADGRIMFEERYAEAPAFTLTRVDLAGDTLWRRTFRYAPLPFTAEQLDSVAAAAARNPTGAMPMAGAGGARATSPEDSAVIQRRVRAELSFPPNQPAIASAWLADDGGVWLRRRSGEDGTNAPRWIVLDAEARPRGEVTLPAGARVVWSRGEVAWVVEADEMGVPWLVRYRLAG